jgi:F-type H+-transporting ATPase subunit delta
MEEIGQVYARALFEVAEEKDKIDEVREELGEFTDALTENRDLSLFFFSPYFSADEKKDGLEKAVADGDEDLMRFLGVLLENHRMPAINRIRTEYDRLWAEERKLLPVEVTSAIELDEKTVNSIGDRIGEQTDRNVELTTNVDPDILGGIVLRVGNSILDASIRRRLEQLRRQVARG